MKRFFIIFSFFVFIIGRTLAQDEMVPNESFLLNSGWEMPCFGIDLSSMTPVQAENTAYSALAKGFLLIDTAGSSGNEEEIGRGIRKAIEEGIVSREEIFISAGIWIEESADMEEAGNAAVQRTLDLLGMEYVDLMVVNQSRFDLDLSAYQALERAVETGSVRSIGLSGFDDSRNFDLLVSMIDIPPAVLQVETHPYHQNKEIRQHIQQYGTLIEARNPLGGKDDRSVLFADPVISLPATWYQKTSDQIILRWHLQSGNIFIPEAADDARLEEYAGINDFSLTEDEMEEINALDRTLSYVYY